MAGEACIICKKSHSFSREEALQIMRKTPDTLRELLDGVSADAFSSSNAHQWSPRKILIHLIDSEFVYGFRMRLIMAGKEPTITPMDQDEWNDTFHYGALNAEQLIRAFTPIRRVNLELLQNIDSSLLKKVGNHPEFGKLSVGILIPHIASHDQSHLQQIRERLPVG